MEDLTRAEKAALYFQIIERCDDWKQVYSIAIGEDRFNKLTDKTKNTNTSRWKVSHRIQKAREEIERNFNARDEDLKRKAVEAAANGETEGPAKKAVSMSSEDINFLDPDQFLQFANQQANTITDEKERRAYLEMIAKLMNYKDKDSEEQEQIKAYLPVNCESCELYRRCKSCNLDRCPI